MSLHSPAREVLSLMREMADGAFRGSVADGGPVFDNITPDLSGFCIHLNGSLALVELGTSGIPDWMWAVQVTSGLAQEVPNTPQLMQWVNERNRTTVLGKYYCTIGQNDHVSVLYETMLWGGYFKILFENNPSPELKTLVAGRIRAEMSQIVETGDRQRTEVVELFGGHVFDCTPAGLMALFAVSC